MRNNIIAGLFFLSSAAMAAVTLDHPAEEMLTDATISEALCEPIGGGDLWHCLILDRKRFATADYFDLKKDPVPYAHLDISRVLNFRHDLNMLFIEAVTSRELERWLDKQK